jgi:hypothetical protein
MNEVNQENETLISGQTILTKVFHGVAINTTTTITIPGRLHFYSNINV